MTSHVYITINLFNLCQQSFLPFYIFFLNVGIGWMNRYNVYKFTRRWPYTINRHYSSYMIYSIQGRRSWMFNIETKQKHIIPSINDIIRLYFDSFENLPPPPTCRPTENLSSPLSGPLLRLYRILKMHMLLTHKTNQQW